MAAAAAVCCIGCDEETAATGGSICAAAGSSSGEAAAVDAASGGGGGAEKEISIGALMVLRSEIFLGFAELGNGEGCGLGNGEDDFESFPPLRRREARWACV